MHSFPYLTLDRETDQVAAAELDSFAKQISGGVLRAGDDEYDNARGVWNGTVDRRPLMIARCRSDADVQAALRFATDRRMLTSIRGGGHHIAGNAVAEGGLMLDLSARRTVDVDPANRTASVGPGALLGDLDRATQAHGLAAPLGINSTTGVAGLTLGGGFGWLSRRHGLTVDNLVGATMVTADGKVRQVSASSDPDLFWAIRGGGGNFGVVTGFEFALHPVGPQVYSGLVVYPLAQAGEVLRAWRDFTANAPDELTVWAVLRKAPPLPFLAERDHGTDVVVLPLLYCGDVEAGERVAAPVQAFGRSIGTALGPTPYAGFQTAFDPLLAPGSRNYWKSHNFGTLSDRALDLVVAAAARLPGPECEIFLAQLGGAIGRVGAKDTAFAARDTGYLMNVHGRWGEKTQDEQVRSWARQTYQDLAPHATGSGYVNFFTEDDGERVAASYGVNYPRLQAVKSQFDPGNLFRMNLNIAPAHSVRAHRG
jgi:FAD/FMN-containing dehydrogenase